MAAVLGRAGPAGGAGRTVDYVAPRTWASTASSSLAALVSIAGRTSTAAIAGWEARPADGLARWRAGRRRIRKESLYGRARLSGAYKAPQPTGWNGPLAGPNREASAESHSQRSKIQRPGVPFPGQRSVARRSHQSPARGPVVRL
jgi:hypothetical protein